MKYFFLIVLVNYLKQVYFLHFCLEYSDYVLKNIIFGIFFLLQIVDFIKKLSHLKP